MKVQEAESRVVTSQGLEGAPESFKIKTNAHAFKMLSSGMYSDKVLAVLREIGCNAHDAHIAMGTPARPIQVKLPTAIDKQFWIKDWGPGLSHDEVMNLYVSYFSSTKQDSNDYTGAFGLGSKSPFSYTDSFTVTSCHGGKKRIYNAHVGANGTPAIVLMGTYPLDDDWKSGMMVGFPVQQKDVHEFHEKAEKAFAFFNPLPEVLGGKKIEPMKYTLDRGTWALHADDRFNGNFRANNYVVMGNVAYPLTFQHMHGIDFVDALRNTDGLILRLPIGAVQVAGSREALQYDPHSVKALADAIVVVAKYMLKDLVAAWDVARKGEWSKKCEFNELRHTLQNQISITQSLLTKVGAPDPVGLANALTNRLHPMPRHDDPKVEVAYVRKEPHKPNMVSLSRPWASPSGHIGVPYDVGLKIVVGDSPNAYRRVRKAVLDGVINSAIMFLPCQKNGGTTHEARTVADRWKADFGITDHMGTAILAAPPAPVRAKKVVGIPPLPGIQVARLGTVNTFEDLSAITKDKVYVRCKTRVSWGRTSHFVTFPPHKDHMSRWATDGHVRLVTKAREVVDIVGPVCLTDSMIKRFKMAERTDWQEYGAYLKDHLSSKAVGDKIKKLVVNQIDEDEINVRYVNDDVSGILRVAVAIKEKEPAIYALVEPIFDSSGLKGLMEKHKKLMANPTGASKPLKPGVEAVRELTTSIGTVCQVPNIKTCADEAREKFPRADKVTLGTFKQLYEVNQDMFKKFIKHLLKEKP